MQYSLRISSIQRHFTIAVIMIISLVLATSAPVKAFSVHQSLVSAAENLKSSITAAIDRSIVMVKQNEKDMIALRERLEGVKTEVVAALFYTREEIGKFIEGANAIKKRAAQLAQQGAVVLKEQLNHASAFVDQQADETLKVVNAFIEAGQVITEDAKELAQIGKERLAKLNAAAGKFTKEQIAKATAFINDQIKAANDIVQKVGNQVGHAVTFVESTTKAVGDASGKLLQSAIVTVEGIVEAGKAATTNAVKQATAGMDMLQSKVREDLQAIKNAVKVKADRSGVGIDVNLGNGLVMYAGINIPPEVAESLKNASQKTVSTLSSIKDKLQKATDPALIREKVKEAVKKINDAAVSSAYARTTKAINSQIDVVNGLQVSANALQTQINKLQQCIKKSQTSSACEKLRTHENSVDQGASLKEKIRVIRVNIDTVRKFLSASVSLVTMLKNENYRSTIGSMKAMVAMMKSVASLSGDLHNDMSNLSNAVNK